MWGARGESIIKSRFYNMFSNLQNIMISIHENAFEKFRLQYGGQFVQASTCWYIVTLSLAYNSHQTPYCLYITDVIMSVMASQITGALIVYSTVCLGANQRKHQSSASLTFVRWIHRRPVYFPHKWPVTRKTFLFNDVIMVLLFSLQSWFLAEDLMPSLITDKRVPCD